MTTNHPEKLDAALIRPGRIDKIVYLGYMQCAEAKEMLQHNFDTKLTTIEYTKLEDLLTSPGHVADFTPAELEQMCAEYDTIELFLISLEDKILENTANKAIMRNTSNGGVSGAASLMRKSSRNDMSIQQAPTSLNSSSNSTSNIHRTTSNTTSNRSINVITEEDDDEPTSIVMKRGLSTNTPITKDSNATTNTNMDELKSSAVE